MQPLRSLYLLGFLAGTATFLFPAEPDESTRIRFTNLSKATPGGLRTDLVRDLTQDVAAYVWMATDRGLTRFDGWETVHYVADPLNGLSSDQLSCVAVPQKKAGPLWIGTTSNGLMRFDPRTGKSVWLLKDSAKAPVLRSNQITDLAISKETSAQGKIDEKFLWIGTDAGLNVLNLDTESMVVVTGPLGNAPITSISTPKVGEVWVGTAAGELYQWNGREGAFSKFWSTTVPVTAVASDAKNTLWIGTAGLGLFTYSKEQGATPRPRPLDGRKQINCLLLDSNTDIWIGTNRGLSLYDRNNDAFIHFLNSPRHADSLSDDQVTTIFEDPKRMLWIATKGGGTSRFSLDRKWFTHLRFNPSRHPGLPDQNVRSFVLDRDDQVWVGTMKGLALWNENTGSYQNLPADLAGLDDSLIRMLVDRSGDLWLGTAGTGLIRRSRDGKVTRYRHDPAIPATLGHDNIGALLEDEDGILYIGTLGGGLHRFEVADGTFARIDSKQPVDFVEHLAQDHEGRIWLVSKEKIHLLEKGQKTLREFSEIFPGAERRSSARTTTILPDLNGIFWIGTADAGLDRFNANTGEIINYNSIIHGLPDDHIVSLVKDSNNLLWVATRSGVARLNAMQNEFRVFNEEDGLQRAGFNAEAIVRDRKGRLFFGGQDGFNIIDPAGLPPMPRPPRPILTGFEYFGETVVPTEGGILEKPIAATDEISIPFDRRLLFSLKFANFDFRFPNRGEFRYMLEGYDKDWIISKEDRRATYAGLIPGDYIFKVQGSLDGKDWQEESARVKLIITPPWWETWWARTLAALGFVLGIVSFTRISLRRRVRQMRMRETMLTAQRDKAEAALARQLQHRMLLDRSYRNIRNDTPDDQILSGPLEQITLDFAATHCLVMQLTRDAEADSRPQLKQLGYWAIAAGDHQAPALTYDDPFVRQIFASKTVLTFLRPDSIPDPILDILPDGTPVTVLAAKTSFLDTANGIIILLRAGDAPAWSAEEQKLLGALTGQFGIAIAQLQTAEIEETYKRHLEEARHHAEVANRAKSDFLAKMTHELRTPLNAIIGFSEILGSDKTLAPRQRETLDIINRSGEHLLDVINEILDLSKIEGGKMERNDETFEFIPLLKSVHEMLQYKADEKRIGFNFAARSGLPGEIVTDRSKLRQILINLIANAIKFTAQGAVGISVATEVLGEAENVAGRLRRRIRLHFEIRDTGRGIHQDEIGKLFERYSQTESGRRTSEGTGLGLPIARSFVQLMGGDIEVESVFGEGTTFRFSIECDELAPAVVETGPVAAALDEKSAQRINGFTSDLGEVRILIAEDQPTNRLLLKRILGKAGFVLAEAENGQAAIEKWNEWHPHLILMDEDMPIKKGTEATREIQALADPDHKPVIISLTAYALEQARLSALEAGCSDFVAKPFRSHELFSVIAKHLGVEYTFNEAA